MSPNNITESTNSCDDCPLYVSVVEADKIDQALIEELEVIKLMREVYLADTVNPPAPAEQARRSKQFEFNLWVLENETYKDDPDGFKAEMERQQTAIQANADRFKSKPGVSLTDNIAAETSDLFQALVRRKFRHLLIDSVTEPGCPGPDFKKGGWLGLKVTALCMAPITDLEKKLAANPEFNDSIQ